MCKWAGGCDTSVACCRCGPYCVGWGSTEGCWRATGPGTDPENRGSGGCSLATDEAAGSLEVAAVTHWCPRVSLLSFTSASGWSPTTEATGAGAGCCVLTVIDGGRWGSCSATLGLVQEVVQPQVLRPLGSVGKTLAAMSYCGAWQAAAAICGAMKFATANYTVLAHSPPHCTEKCHCTLGATHWQYSNTPVDKDFFTKQFPSVCTTRKISKLIKTKSTGGTNYKTLNDKNGNITLKKKEKKG